MGSRVTTPERRTGAPRRVAAALPVFLFVAVAAAGCPDREASLSVSSEGIGVLVKACRACDRLDDAGVEPVCACALTDRPGPEVESRSMQARLFLITPSDQKVRDASKCMTLLPCADAGHRDDCVAENLNQQLDGALPNGLGFDGLSNPDDVQLILAFYQAVDAASITSCNRADLIACAGLAPPLGGGTYDITCASCQGGSKTAFGPDNGPCPMSKSGCFLKDCDTLLANNGF
jgi:hypothetical protein